ncbi:MAG: aminotransferase class V-fold PLP-dependent enzyme [SAR202 cluster bacterium]|nr:aminotransferase class V-fold PLP-dependent enzyme [SAR202 cluster bacterium]MDP6713309.1 aminotransferase class V-fold PLP-dependent enzyme [SAR202 cluster bacterium]
MVSGPGADIYRSLGVKPIITASGSTTAYGGSKLRPEVKEAMDKAAGTMVNIDDLNRAAGKVIADITGAEAGFVSSGSAGGLILQAAAVMAGNDPAKMKRLPDPTGMKNEIVIHRSHRFPYDQCYLATGATFREIGDGRRCHPWELEDAINENTAAVAYLFSNFLTRRALPFEQVVEIAHAHDVPVIVDAASYVPPRANLKRFIAQGADMVQYSGGKAVRGPQGTGILCGREDLIEAAFASASPHQFIGRGMKVSKESIIGLVEAVQLFVDEDEEAETRLYTSMCQQVVDALIEIPGLNINIEHDAYDYLTPHAVMKFTNDWRGPSRDETFDAMVAGDPPVYLHNIHHPDELAVDPFNLEAEELDIVICRLREVLLGH